MQNLQAAQSGSSMTSTPNVARCNDQVMTPSAVSNVDTSLNRSTGMTSVSSLDVQAPPAKRMKIEATETVVKVSDSIGATKAEPVLPSVGAPNIDVQEMNESKSTCRKLEVSSVSNDKVPKQSNQVKLDQGVEDGAVKQDPTSVGLSKAPVHIKQEVQQEKVASPIREHGNNSKGGKPKVKGVTLTELFTPEQIREHITGLRQWVGQVYCTELVLYKYNNLTLKETHLVLHHESLAD
jgi:E1A/CREB-binding protein